MSAEKLFPVSTPRLQAPSAMTDRELYEALLINRSYAPESTVKLAEELFLELIKRFKSASGGIR
jgi:hypothetical protein